MHTALSTPLLASTPASTCMAFVTAALAMYTFSTMGAMAVVLWTPSPALRERTQGPSLVVQWERGVVLMRC